MEEKEVNKIMENITNGDTLEVIREALTQYKDEKELKYEKGELDYCEGCEEYIDQIDLGEGSYGCPICKSSNSITLFGNDEDEEIEVNLSEEDLQDLQRGKDFHWNFDGVDIHLFKGEDN